MSAGEKKLPKGWKRVALGELLSYEQPSKYVVSAAKYSSDYKTPVLTAGKTFVLGYTNEENGIFPMEKLPVIIFDDFTTAIKFVDFSFKVKSSAMKILKARDENLANIKYIYNAMSIIEYDATTHKRYWIAEYSKIEIPLPPLAEQKRIVAALDKRLAAVEKARQSAEKVLADAKQLSAALLRDAFPAGEKLPKGWKWVAMENVCDLIFGQSPLGHLYRKEPEGLPFFQGKADFGAISPVPRIWCIQPKKISLPNDILLSIRAPVGPTNINDVECCIGRGLVALRAKEKSLDYKYLFFYLRCTEHELSIQGVGSTFSSIGKREVSAYKIPLPSPAEQKRIIAKLDKQLAAAEKARQAAEQQLAEINLLSTAILREVLTP